MYMESKCVKSNESHKNHKNKFSYAVLLDSCTNEKGKMTNTNEQIEMKKDLVTEKRPEISSLEAPFIHIHMEKRELDDTKPNIEEVLNYLRNNRDKCLKCSLNTTRGKCTV